MVVGKKEMDLIFISNKFFQSVVNFVKVTEFTVKVQVEIVMFFSLWSTAGGLRPGNE